MIRRIRQLLMVVLLVHAASLAAVVNPTEANDEEFSQILLLYNYAATDDPATAESIVAAVNKPSNAPSEIRLLIRLQRPVTASFLIPTRHSAEVRERLGAESPAEYLLRYVVLGYGSAQEAKTALEVLNADRNVKSIAPNLAGMFSTTPADPYFATAASVMNYQWGSQYLGMPNAWDLARGHAYVGHVDSGIQISHPDINFRPQFSYAYDGGSPDEISIGTMFRGHGTHTAGIIAAATSNPAPQYGHPNPPSPIGVAGTCWDCTLLVARITLAPGDAFTVASLAAGMDDARFKRTEDLMIHVTIRAA